MYTAEEYRNLLKMVFTMTIHEAKKEMEKEIEWGSQSPDYNYSKGYLAGLREGLRKVEASEFLSNPDFKDE
ncbi:MAG: hypothetical protein J6J03_05260 [Tyzzerella sp.]|nr:hypothetical protein [Tyzzerella sp.]